VSTLVERLNDPGDHKRLCQGREYLCSCGWDAEVEALLNEAAATITRLEGEAVAYQNTIDGLEFLNKRLDSLEPDQLEGLTAKWPMIMATVAKGEARAEAAEATLAEATSATMMADMRADKLMAEIERLKGVTSVSLLDRLSEAEAENARLREALDAVATAVNDDGTVYTAAQLMALLESRDTYLVSKGLFGEYANSLHFPSEPGVK